MEVVKNTDDIKNLKENGFIGFMPQIKNSTIIFQGKGNVVYCEENVKIENSSIGFQGSGGLLYLSSGKNTSRVIRVICTIHSNCVCCLGSRVAFTQPPILICSEQKHIFIGNDCMIALGVWMRTADPHLIYSVDTKKRINLSKSIYIGDNVWIGQNSLILKGTHVHSGSIVGGNSVLANKKIMSNCSVAGNPARVISENIFWSDKCVHNYIDEQTSQSMISDDTKSIFSYNSQEYVSFDMIDSIFSEKISPDEKSERIHELFKTSSKNRFALFEKN